jgi:hypothetical protein
MPFAASAFTLPIALATWRSFANVSTIAIVTSAAIGDLRMVASIYKPFSVKA